MRIRNGNRTTGRTEIRTATDSLLNGPAEMNMEKTDWSEVMKIADEISKQASVCGMLSTGSTPEELEELIGNYCNLLLGLVLLCHGSTVGAGRTLRAAVRTSAKPIIDRSLSLLREAISSHGAKNNTPSIPVLAGKVWESCSGLKRSPGTDPAAIVRALAQVGISVKDVLRELGEEKEEGGEPVKQAMEVVAAAAGVVTEGIRFVGGHSVTSVEVMEGVLEKLQALGVQVDELGASAFPPVEPEEMTDAATEMLRLAVAIKEDLSGSGMSASALLDAVEDLVGSLGRTVLEVGVEGGMSTLSL